MHVFEISSRDDFFPQDLSGIKKQGFHFQPHKLWATTVKSRAFFSATKESRYCVATLPTVWQRPFDRAETNFENLTGEDTFTFHSLGFDNQFRGTSTPTQGIPDLWLHLKYKIPSAEHAKDALAFSLFFYVLHCRLSDLEQRPRWLFYYTPKNMNFVNWYLAVFPAVQL